MAVDTFLSRGYSKSGFRLAANVTGDGPLINKLMSIIKVMDNPLPLWHAVGKALLQKTQERFDKQRDPKGHPWKKSLAAKLGNRATLTDTRQLRDSINYIANAFGITIGTSCRYAAVHQFGAVITPGKTKGRGSKAKKLVGGKYLRFQLANGRWVSEESITIPKRQFIGVSKVDEKTILSVVNRLFGAK